MFRTRASRRIFSTGQSVVAEATPRARSARSMARCRDSEQKNFATADSMRADSTPGWSNSPMQKKATDSLAIASAASRSRQRAAAGVCAAGWPAR